MDLIKDIFTNIDNILDDYHKENINEYDKPFNPERPYVGIMDSGYMHCGKKRCNHIIKESIFNYQCNQPVYQTNEKYCFYHQKFKITK